MDSGRGSADAAAPARSGLFVQEFDIGDRTGLRRARAASAETPLALVILFVCPTADVASVMGEAARTFGETPVIGCTTAGEIGRTGYSENRIVLLGFPSAHFAAESVLLHPVDQIDKDDLVSGMIRRRARLAAERPGWNNEFAFLLVDGLSLAEDRVAAACSDALGPVPLFGGSAGDGTRFRSTSVAFGGEVHSNAAVLTYFRTACRIRVFSLDHLIPTEHRMVVTGADPKRRVVREINAEPAAREYARILGKDPEQLDTFTFAAHPVAVRFGGKHHVRAIQQVKDREELVFFSAIEEGLVLSLADTEHMGIHLERELTALSQDVTPDAIIACDCILRRLEAQEKQLTREVSAILARHGVVGFSTYGEQMGGMHVNQTMTGVAIYPPEAI